LDRKKKSKPESADTLIPRKVFVEMLISGNRSLKVYQEELSKDFSAEEEEDTHEEPSNSQDLFQQNSSGLENQTFQNWVSSPPHFFFYLFQRINNPMNTKERLGRNYFSSVL